jgi:hypothetical protein
MARVSDHANGAELDLEAPGAVGFEAFAAPETGVQEFGVMSL